MLGYAGDQSIGISHVHHHRPENVALVDKRTRLGERYTPTLAQAEQFLDITLAKRRCLRIDDLRVFQIQAELERSGTDGCSVAKQDRCSDLLFQYRVTGAQD